MTNLVINTSLSNGASVPAIANEAQSTYAAGQSINQLVVLKPGQQFASLVGFSTLSITPSGAVQLTGTRGSDTTFLDQTVNQLTVIDDEVDLFQITNNSTTATVSIRLVYVVAIGTSPPIPGIVVSVNGKTGIVTLTATDIPGLAVVAKTGSYNDLLNKPAAYVLPVATQSVLGGVKPSDGLTVDVNGTLKVAPATALMIGGVKAGANVTIASDGTLSVATPYALPVATSSVLGGVKQGANVNIAGDGTISVAAPYVLPVATTTVVGGVKQGPNTIIAGDGTLTAVTPIASTTVLGGVLQGAGVTIAGDGTLSANVRTVAGRAGDVTLAVADVAGAVAAADLAAAGGAGMVGFGSSTVSQTLNTLNQRLTNALIDITLTCTSANQLVYAVAGGYPVGLIDLYAMGIHLTNGTDYSATDGANITVSSAVAARIPVGATLDLRAIGSFNVANAVDLATLGGTNGAALVGYGSQTVKQVLDTVANRNDLANQTDSTKGTSLIGFTDSVAPAYLKTLSDIVNGELVSINRFFSASQFAAIQAYSSTYDGSQNWSDAINSGARKLRIPQGKYNLANIPLVSGISLIGDDFLRSTGLYPNATVLNLIAPGVLFYTPGQLSSVSFKGLTLQGDPSVVGQGINSRGVWLGKDTNQNLGLNPYPAYSTVANHQAVRSNFEHVIFNNFSQEGLMAEYGAAPYIDACFSQNCLQDLTYLTQQRAAVSLYANDSIVTRCEFASLPGANARKVTSTNLYAAGFGFFGGQSRALGFISDCVCELSDVGAVFDQKGVRAANLRCDQNNGVGLIVRSTGANIGNIHAWNNSLDTDNTYDGIVVEATARGTVIGTWKTNTESFSNRMRYGIRDDVSTSVDPTNKTLIGVGNASNIGTQQVMQTGSSSGGVAYPYGGRMTFTDGATTPSILGYVSWRTLNTSTTQYTNFLNGTNGMCIEIFCNDNFSWLLPSATLRTRTNQPFKMRPNGVYRLTCDTGIWTAHDVAGDVTDSMSSLTWKPILRFLPPVTDVVLSGAQVLDGVQSLQGDLCLLVNQTNTAQNGPWVIQNSTWIRPTWWPSGGVTQAFVNVIFFVYDGLLNANSYWRMNNTGVITIDTTGITIVPLRPARLTTNQASPTAWIDAAASVVARASIRMRGGVAPTTPNEGDMWNDNTNLKMNVAGTTYTVAKLLSASASLSFPATAAGNTSDLTVTVTGAAVGDEVALGVPATAMATAGIYTAWVSVANTVNVRFNNTTGASITPAASSTFRVSVIKR